MSFKKYFRKRPLFLYLTAIVLILIITTGFSVKIFEEELVQPHTTQTVLVSNSAKVQAKTETAVTKPNSEPTSFLNQILPFFKNQDYNNQEVKKPETLNLISENNPTFGNAQSLVTVVEFLDFQCPACKATFPVMELAEQKYDTKVRFVYKMYPLENIHKNARSAAKAALAANEQDKFKQYVTKLFANQDQGISDEVQLQIAKDIGLDIEKWKTDKNSVKINNIIDEDLKVGQTMQVQTLGNSDSEAVISELTGTPTFVFMENNKPQFQLIGTITIEEIYDHLNRLLHETEPQIVT